MELRHLRYFVAVAEELNFTRAAKRLRVSQPPLSRQVQQLEEEAGAKLFIRGKRGVQLTAAGEFFLKKARLILAESQQALQLARAAQQRETGHLGVAYTATIFDPVISQTLRQFREKFPLVELDVREMSGLQQTEALMEGKIDMGYVAVRFPELEKELMFECVRRVPVWVALPPGHPLAKKRLVRMEDLANEAFVLPTWTITSFQEWFLKICRTAGFMPKIAQRAENAHGMLGLVSAGVGVALVPEIAQRFMPLEVEFRPLPASLPKFEFHIVTRRDNASPLLKVFLEMLRKKMGVGV
jgi:DNA-binding transcriptional LysR family regulator